MKNNIIKITLNPLNFNIYLKIINNKIYWSEQAEPNLEITLTPSAIIKAKIHGFEKCIKNKDIKISGDMMVAMQLREILESFDFDVETKLANIFGDFFAVNTVGFFSGMNTKKNKIIESFKQDLKEFLEDELQIIVTREEVDEFVKEVDELRFAVDRLYANRS